MSGALSKGTISRQSVQALLSMLIGSLLLCFDAVGQAVQVDLDISPYMVVTILDETAFDLGTVTSTQIAQATAGGNLPSFSDFSGVDVVTNVPATVSVPKTLVLERTPVVGGGPTISVDAEVSIMFITTEGTIRTPNLTPNHLLDFPPGEHHGPGFGLLIITTEDFDVNTLPGTYIGTITLLITSELP